MTVKQSQAQVPPVSDAPTLSRRSGMMTVTRRSGLVLLLAISVLVGFTVRSVAFRPVATGVATSDTAANTTAVAFYAALNAALSGESADPLRNLLSPIFVDHRADTGGPQTIEDFLAQVDSIGDAPQQVQLQVISIEQAAGIVVAGIRPVDDGPIEAAGMTIEQTSPPTHFEMLRVQRGVIVDRWAPSFTWLDVTEPVGVAPTIGSTVGFSTSLVRVELTGSEERTWRSTGAEIVVVEAGSASLALGSGAGAQSSKTLDEREFVSILAGTHVRLRAANAGSVSVVIYWATRTAAAETAPPGSGSGAAAEAGKSTLLWGGSRYWIESDVVHRPGLIVLPPGAEITLWRQTDTALLVSVQRGAIEASVAGGSVAALDENRWPERIPGVVQLDASHAGWIEDDGAVTLRNPTELPVTVLLIALEPVARAGASGTPCSDPCLSPPLFPPGK